MREIKCRAKVKWNGNHFFAGDWVEGFYAYKELTDEHVILIERANMNRPGSYFAEAEVIEETVGQYTGLKDMNGEEIYEGDICKYREDTEGQIRFEDGCFWFDCTDWSEPIYIFSDWEFEVIGNIHENQELLEVK